MNFLTFNEVKRQKRFLIIMGICYAVWGYFVWI